MPDFQYTKLDKSKANFRVDRFPDICPRCHHSGNFPFLSAREAPFIYYGTQKTFVECVFTCEKADCLRHFLGRYKRDSENFGIYQDCYPRAPKAIVFSDEIDYLSPQFAIIYNQAITAEGAELDQIAGVGLRKALEFLVKDFLIFTQPIEKHDGIRSTLLGPCINNYIDNRRIKESAQAAVYLGNDETHYTRKWTDHDISDLKLLIRNVVNHIEIEVTDAKYKDQLLPKKAAK